MDLKEYVLTSVSHSASQPWLGDTETVYKNTFTCIPYDVPFRPPLVTPRSVIHGSQTAIVVGPSGEEIYTDKFGRVKVQFHWDREGNKDENTTCWIRVGQIWAGQGWGAVFIPRIGHEVIVSFLEGDPDRPIVTGSVYDSMNMPPYPLPAEKTKSTIKSNSSKGGGGFNELRIEDKKGSEEVYLHGEKDWNILIKNDKGQNVGHDETLSVGNNRTKAVGADQAVSIGNNHTETIGANKSINVGANKDEMVTINTTETIGVAKELTIGGAYQVSVGAAMNETVGAIKAEEIGANKSVIVGANSSEQIGGNKSVQVGKNISEQIAGKHDEQVTKEYSLKAKKISLTAEDEFTIKTGSAEIIMKKNGDITIKGKKINVTGSGNITMKGKKILQN